MARVIQGVPTSWDSSIASKGFPDDIYTAVWSSCSRLIAAADWETPKAVVLDAVTLEQLYTLHSPSKQATLRYLTFSPNNCLLTGYSYRADCIVTWDLLSGSGHS